MSTGARVGSITTEKVNDMMTINPRTSVIISRSSMQKVDEGVSPAGIP